MILAEPGSRVSILFEDFADGRVVPPDDGVISGIAGGLLSNHTKSHGVMVASGEQCRSRGRAERGGMELGISKPGLRDPVQRWRWDDTAEGARNAVALVVRHDEQNIGRALGRHDARRPLRLGVLGIHADHGRRTSAPGSAGIFHQRSWWRLGDPGVPLICWAGAERAAAKMAAANIAYARM